MSRYFVIPRASLCAYWFSRSAVTSILDPNPNYHKKQILSFWARSPHWSVRPSAPPSLVRLYLSAIPSLVSTSVSPSFCRPSLCELDPLIGQCVDSLISTTFTLVHPACSSQAYIWAPTHHHPRLATSDVGDLCGDNGSDVRTIQPYVTNIAEM